MCHPQTEDNDVKKLALAILCVVLAASCRPAKIEHPTLEEAGKIADAAEASFTSGDPFRIMEHYAPNAVYFDASTNEPTSDRAVATKWTENFVALKPVSFSPGKRIVQILGWHTFVSSGVATMEVSGKSGPEKISIRYTDVYQLQPDKTWLIVHEHLSNLPNPAAK